MRRTELRRTPLLTGGTSGGWGKPSGGVISGGRSSHPRVGGHRIERDSAAIVRKRSGGRCEIGIKGCWGVAVEKSHRIARGAGGCFGEAKRLSDRPSDLLDSCLHCHLLITRYAWKVRAKFHGWVLTRSQDPTAAKVFYRGEWKFLGDNGEVASYEKAGT